MCNESDLHLPICTYIATKVNQHFLRLLWGSLNDQLSVLVNLRLDFTYRLSGGGGNSVQQNGVSGGHTQATNYQQVCQSNYYSVEYNATL